MAGVRVLAVVGAVLAVVAIGGGLGADALVVALPLAVTVVAAPDLALGRAVRTAQHRMSAAVPPMLDLLAACLEAGIPTTEALRRCAESAPVPLCEVLSRVVAGEGPAGSVARSLRERGAEAGVAALGTAARLIERAHRSGEPIAATLLSLADSTRSEAAAAAAARVRRRATAATLVVAIVITPGSVAVVLALLAGGLLSGGSGSGP